MIARTTTGIDAILPRGSCFGYCQFKSLESENVPRKWRLAVWGFSLFTAFCIIILVAGCASQGPADVAISPTSVAIGTGQTVPIYAHRYERLVRSQLVRYGWND